MGTLRLKDGTPVQVDDDWLEYLRIYNWRRRGDGPWIYARTMSEPVDLQGNERMDAQDLVDLALEAFTQACAKGQHKRVNELVDIMKTVVK